MSFSRPIAVFLAAAVVFIGSVAHAGIQAIPDQTIPSGKTLVVPIPATDPTGPARSYTVTVGAPTISGTPTSTAGIVATIRTGDPHLLIGVTYTDSNSILQSGTMEFQLLREFSPNTAQIIGGLTQGGFYNPLTAGTLHYVTFYRVVPGFVIQGGDPTDTGTGGPGFGFENEFSSALIYSATAGQLAMANAGTNANGGTNGSDFFITLAPLRYLDFGYTIFGQLLRGYDTLNGIAGTAVRENPLYNEVSSPVSPVNIASAAVSSNNTDAVLLLSATGICDSEITVTASSAGVSSVATFTAHAVADSTSDPPFLQPVPNTVARDGTAQIPLQGADLQLDLLSYDYDVLRPTPNSNIASGTSPLLSIPLVSNTDNAFDATLEHYNPPYVYYEPDRRVFHIAAGDKPITGSLTPIPPGHHGGLSLQNFPVAVFATDNLKDTASSFTATINWGDGTFLSGANLTIERTSRVLRINRYKLIASHDYQTPGEYPVIVNVSDPGGARLALTGTASVGASEIALVARDFTHTGGAIAPRVVATFVDDSSPSPPSAYSAIINWGDGLVSPGAVRRIAGATYEILAGHLFRTSGTFTLSASVSRTGDSASAWATARIAGVKTPQLFPPFPQAHLAQVWTAVETGSTYVPISTGPDGAAPAAALIQGTDDYLYGTTQAGGSYGAGTVFKITTAGAVAILHSFGTSYDGQSPRAGLVQATDGNLYGTTSGYSDHNSTVFQITTAGSLNTLYIFTDGTDGAAPDAGLIQGADGSLYGTTSQGDLSTADLGNGFGTIFSITTSGSLNTLAGFNYNDGSDSQAALVEDADQNFYGTTISGGPDGEGTVFELSSSGSLNTLYSFTGGNDGAAPSAALVQGTDGWLYGTTKSGGKNGDGTIFKITTNGSLSVLYSFSGSDGAASVAPLINGTDGNFYGTTSAGGGGSGSGTVFQLTPAGSITTLHYFSGSDGRAPLGGLVQAADGDLYGTTSAGGTNFGGTVFKITTSGSLTTLHEFGNTTLQYWVRANATIINSGNRTSPLASFSVYVDPNGMLDGNQTVMTFLGLDSNPVPSLAPGKSYGLEFGTVYTYPSAADYYLYLPAGFDPTGQGIIGVVNYSDPVGDFDGSQRIAPLGSF